MPFTILTLDLAALILFLLGLQWQTQGMDEAHWHFAGAGRTRCEWQHVIEGKGYTCYEFIRRGILDNTPETGQAGQAKILLWLRLTSRQDHEDMLESMSPWVLAGGGNGMPFPLACQSRTNSTCSYWEPSVADKATGRDKSGTSLCRLLEYICFTQ